MGSGKTVGGAWADADVISGYSHSQLWSCTTRLGDLAVEDRETIDENEVVSPILLFSLSLICLIGDLQEAVFSICKPAARAGVAEASHIRVAAVLLCHIGRITA